MLEAEKRNMTKMRACVPKKRRKKKKSEFSKKDERFRHYSSRHGKKNSVKR
jgi:hypothetical protein